MKLTKGQKIVAIVSLAILIFSTVIALMSGLVEGFKFWIPILNFFFFFLLGLSVVSYVLGFVTAKTQYFFFGFVLLLPCLLYACIMCALPWWAILIICFAAAGISALLSLLFAGNMTESVVTDRNRDKDKK